MSTDSYGTVIDVSTTNTGEPTLVDSLAASSVLTVANAWTFDQLGGQLRVNGLVLDYLTVDAGTGVITLTVPLAADVLADTYVEIWPLAPVKVALVDFGILEGSEAVAVTVPHSMVAVIPDGMREDWTRETVLVEERSPGELVLVDVVATPAQIELETLPGEVLDNALDGAPPAGSPNPVVQGMIGALHVHWEAIENHDLVTYEVHISDVDDFTPSIDTLVGLTTATTMVVRTLPTDLLLVFDTLYYVKLVATDGDGASSASVQGSGQIMKADQESISASFVYGGQISASQITGGTITGDVIIGGAIRTAESGGRTEIDNSGMSIYDPAGAVGTVIGPELSFFKGDAEIDGLTVKTTMSVRGTANELSTGAELELASNSTAPSTSPSVVQTWDSQTFTKAGDASFNAANITSVTRVGTTWVCGYDAGSIYKVYIFNAAGAFTAEALDPYTSSLDNASTQISAVGRVYTIKSNGDLVRHKQNAADYSYIFEDDFTSSVASSRWPTQVGDVAWDSGSGGRARLTGEARIDTAWDKNLQDAFVSAKMSRGGVYGSPREMLMELYHTNNNEVAKIWTEGSTLWFEAWDPLTGGIGSSISKTSITYSASTHAYWKIWEEDNKWKFATSADGVTWTSRHSATHTLSSGALAAIQIEFQSDENSAPGGDQIVYVDNVRHGLINEDLIVAYSRVNASQRPAIGNDGTNLLLAEYNATNNTIRIQTVNATTLAVISTVTSTVQSFSGPLAGILVGTFDMGATHYVTKAVGSGDWWVLNSSGAFQNTRGFPADNGGSKWITWDGTNFWALGTDGKLYKHTSIMPSGTTSSVPYCAAFTWYDSNATGGTHETTISPVASFSLKRRAKITVTSPAIPPGGGTDDINSIRIYMGATSGTLTLQSTTAAGVNSASYTALVTGIAPPVSGNFPGATPAKIKNAAGTLEISGDGTIKATVITQNAMPGGSMLLTTVGGQSITHNTGTAVALNFQRELSGMTWDSTNKRFVIGKAGRYQINAGAMYKNAGTSGRAQCQIFINGVQQSNVSTPFPSVAEFVSALCSLAYRLAVGDTVALFTTQTTGVSRSLHEDEGCWLDVSWLSY
jgi:hypothetical protein